MRLTQDVVAGLVVIALAIGILFGLSRIPATSYQAIAPDLFPRLCAYGLMLGGLALVVRGVRSAGPAAVWPSPRGLVFVTASVIGFGLLAPRIGYAIAG